MDAWIRDEVNGCDLGDRRLDRRLGRVLEDLSSRIGKKHKILAGAHGDGRPRLHTVCDLLLHSRLVVTIDGFSRSVCGQSLARWLVKGNHNGDTRVHLHQRAGNRKWRHMNRADLYAVMLNARIRAGGRPKKGGPYRDQWMKGNLRNVVLTVPHR